MEIKTVALDSEAYMLLRWAKRPDETFSEAVKRLARPRKHLVDFAGIWADMPKKELREIAEAVAKGKAKERERIRRFALE